MSGRHNDLTNNLTKNLVLEGETLLRTVGHTSHQGAVKGLRKRRSVWCIPCPKR